MTRRIDQKDTLADVELRGCIESKPPQSFTMVAGAGSGKTTSLIKGLGAILRLHGERLRLRRQKVACITYTEIAAGEIWADVGNNPLVHVSTIHSFYWSLIRSFQPDIKVWVSSRIEEKLAELQSAAANFGPRVQQKTREKNRREIQRYEVQRGKIGRVQSFRYGTGSDYVNGVLGHDDVIRMVSYLLLNRPLLRQLLSQQFPFVFVDESQDTFPDVVSALKSVCKDNQQIFCLGFFGDPVQRIYQTGVGSISKEPGWAEITKPENFRCPATILAVANSVRRDADGLVQTRGRMVERDGRLESVPGSASIFIAPIDNRRDQRLTEIRAWIAERNHDPEWRVESKQNLVKVLVIVHRMAANRLGFGDLYAALNDKAPEQFKNGFLDATAWPVRPFTSFLLPLVAAAKRGDEFAVMQALRTQSRLLQPDSLPGKNVSELLSRLREFTNRFCELIADSSTATNREVLMFLHETAIIEIDPRILSYLDVQRESVGKTQNATDGREADPGEEEDDLTKEIASMEAFLHCPARQFWGYFNYINAESPFSTQQGIKGAEFERVLVVLDDDEGTHVQFSYDKYFGIRELSDKEQQKRAAGEETTVERTRRLFYVCCTRAMKDLVVVLFANNASLAQAKVRELNIFPENAIHICES